MEIVKPLDTQSERGLALIFFHIYVSEGFIAHAESTSEAFETKRPKPNLHSTRWLKLNPGSVTTLERGFSESV